jgi:hypothetical protein
MADHHRLATPEQLGDRRQTAGGPRSPDRNPNRHGRKLTTDLAGAIAASRSPIAEGIDPRHVFKVRTVSRIAESGWTGRGLEPLGESSEGWTYFVLTSDATGTQLNADLAQYAASPDADGAPAPLSSVFGLIEEVLPYGPDDRRGPGLPDGPPEERIIVDIELWPSGDRDEAARRTAEVKEVLAETEGDVLVQDLRPQFTVVRARVDDAGLTALLDLPVVERIRTPPEPLLDPTDWLGATLGDLEVHHEDGEPVGVIDDGVHAHHPLLAGVVKATISVPDESHFTEPPSGHGTMVAGLASYSDFEVPLRDGQALTGRPVYSARVLESHPDFPDRTRFPEDVLEHVATEDAIRRLNAQGVRVFNLSITDDVPYSGPHVSGWTESIDALIRELGIVVVIAAGNVPGRPGSQTTSDGADYRRDYPAYCLAPGARVAEPAVAALALTAGSLARSAGPATPSGTSYPGSRAIAESGELSPFSRTGPGFADNGAVKPDVVHYGGNWVVADTGSLDVRNAGVSTVTLSGDPARRMFTIANGTSFAAPRVSRLAADVWHRYPAASANLVRTLVALSADVPATGRIVGISDQLRAYGNGRPSLVPASESGGNRTVLVFEGSIDVDGAVVHSIPVPEAFAQGRSSRRIRIAIAYDPPVRRQRREYLAGRLSADLVRNMSLKEIDEVFGAQDDGQVTPLPADRRRPTLRPGTSSFAKSTLQVREWRRQQLNVDDGDEYHVVVTHRRAPWSDRLREPYDRQDYALAVEMVDEGRVDLDLHELVRARLAVSTPLLVRTTS